MAVTRAFGYSAGHRIILALIAIASMFVAVNATTNSALIREDVMKDNQYAVVSKRNVRVFKPKTGKANAAFAILVRNREKDSLVSSIKQLESRFNSKYNYPYVLMNDEEFTEDFKTAINAATAADVQYGTIDKSMWGYPDFIDQKKAEEGRKHLSSKGIIYGMSESYRHMCRYQSGYFFRHPLMMKYDYYWRVEPGVDYHCDIDYDVFAFMEAKDFVYGWTLSLTDYPETLETFWPTVTKWVEKHPDWMTKGNSSLRQWLHDDPEMKKYNFCHFWSNFEIGSLKFFRSEKYLSYFEHLDKSGGFFYERWGDAPVHSVAVALLVPEHQVHFFNDIGYTHPPLTHCPIERELQAKCSCETKDRFEEGSWTCNHRMEKRAPGFSWSIEKLRKETNPFAIKPL